MFLRTFLTLIVGFVAAAAYAAPEKSETKSRTSPSTEFAKLSREYTELTARLTQMRKRYQADPNADKKAIEAEWKDKVKQLEDLRLKLAATAEKAYLAAPNKNDQESEFLFSYLVSLVQSDDYEQAVRLIKVLSDHGFEHKYFNLVSGLSYFGISDFENAKKYLTLAKDAKEIDTTGDRYLGQIDKHAYQDLWRKELEIRAAEDKAGNLPKVKLNTSKGDIVIALLENEAPIATANFISLVEKKFFDGLKFHRVISGFMAQGGDPSGDGSGGPGYTIPDECYQDNRRNHFRGTLSMANSGQRDTGGSQFFLTFLPTSHLDGKHTVFGRVVEGTDVLAKLQRCQPGDSSTPDTIVKATVLSKRNHRYEPVTRPDKK